MRNALEEVKAWLSHVEGIFNRMLRVYLGARYAPIRLLIGNTSYTDHSKIVVSISEDEALTMSRADLMRVLTLKAYHEAGHCRYSDQLEYSRAVDDIAYLWESEAVKAGYSPSRRVLGNLGNSLLNTLEDGRMENQLVKDVPGIQKHREWYRLGSWLRYSSAEQKKAGIPPFSEIMNNLLDIATIGIYCRDFETSYPVGDKVRNVVDACIAPVTAFIKSPTIEKGAPHALAVAQNLMGTLLDMLAEDPDIFSEKKGPEMIKLPPELEELIRKALESQENFSKGDTEETESDGPIIGILTDDMDMPEDDLKVKTPDILIDLRKNPSKSSPEPLDHDTGEKEKGQRKAPSKEEKDEKSTDTRSKDKDIPPTTGSQLDEERGDNDVNQTVLQAGAEAFEASIRERLEKAAHDTSLEVASRVSQADRALEAANKIEEKKSGLNSSDVDLLHEAGYLSNYYDRVPCRNVIRERGLAPSPVPPGITTRGRRIETEIRNIISSRSEPERDYLFDGDLDESAIGRFISFGQGDIFCQEGDPKEPDMCVYVRQDNSGSMSGSKFKLACEAGALIEAGFKNLVPLKLTYFTDSEFNVIKDWDDMDTSRSYMTDFGYHFGPGGGNDDALAIMSAALELTHRPESHKVLIIISDGAPCCSIEAVTAAVQWARKSGIFVISFFIGDSGFIERSWELYKQMYEKYFCGVSPERLGAVLVRFIRTMIESS